MDCIYEGERSLYIHPDECVDCGACEPVCPVEAIYYEDDVPEQWAEYYKANVEFFDDLGSPGRRRQDRRDRQGPPDHRRPAAAGARRVADGPARALPDFPWDSLAPSKERASAVSAALARGRAAWSTSPSARRSTRRPRSCGTPCARRRTRPATPRRGHAGAARGGRRLVRPPARACPASTPPGCCPRSAPRSSSRWLPAAPRPRRRRRRRASPASPTPPTTSARGSREPPPWSSTRSPPWARSPRRRRQARVAQHAWQPHRQGAGRRAPGQVVAVGPAQRRRRRLRRVLRRARLGA